MKNRLLAGLLATVVQIGLWGCASIPVTNMPRLSALNPIEMDFTQTRVAVRVQEGFRVEKGDVTLTMTVKNHISGEENEEAFALDVDSNAISSKHLLSNMKSGFNIYRFQIDPADYGRMTAFQDDLRTKVEDAGASKTRGGNSFSINVHSDGCLEKGANPFRKMKVTIYLQPTPDEDFLTFIKERNFELPQSESETGIKHCETD